MTATRSARLHSHRTAVHPPVIRLSSERTDAAESPACLSAAWTRIILHRWTAAHFGEGGGEGGREGRSSALEPPLCHLPPLPLYIQREREGERKGRVGVLRPGGAAWIPAWT